MSGTVTTPIFCCGFECRYTGDSTSGTPRHWNSPAVASGNPTIVAAASGLGGNYALRISGAAANSMQHALPASLNTFAVRFYVTVGIWAIGSASLIQFNVTGGNVLIQLRPSLKMRMQSGGQSSVDSAALNVGQRYRIDMAFNTSANPWVASWWIDGVSQSAPANAAVAAANPSTMVVGNTGTNDYTADVDDIIVTNTVSDAPIGPGVVMAYPITASGTHGGTGFASGDFTDDASGNVIIGETTSWSKLDEIPAVNTDFVRQAVVRSGARLEYIYGATVNQAPRAVEQVVFVHNISTTGADQKAQLYDGTTATDMYVGTPAGTVAGTLLSFTKQWGAPPSGGSWTIALFQSLRVRWGFSTNVTTAPAFDTSFLEGEFASIPTPITAASQVIG